MNVYEVMKSTNIAQSAACFSLLLSRNPAVSINNDSVSKIKNAVTFKCSFHLPLDTTHADHPINISKESITLCTASPM